MCTDKSLTGRIRGTLMKCYGITNVGCHGHAKLARACVTKPVTFGYIGTCAFGAHLSATAERWATRDNM